MNRESRERPKERGTGNDRCQKEERGIIFRTGTYSIEDTIDVERRVHN